MPDFISFALTASDREYVRRYASHSAAVRLSLDTADQGLSLPKGVVAWLDGEVDGIHEWSRTSRTEQWISHIMSFEEADAICDPRFQDKPEKKKVRSFVRSLVERLAASAASHFKGRDVWVTVPQLPIVNGNDRNRINRLLAEAFGEEGSRQRPNWKAVFPLIFTHQTQLKGKTQRTPKIRAAHGCFEKAHADGYWAVDLSLSDQLGSSTFARRLPSIVDLHAELAAAMKTSLSIAGPYWGVNLVLWARGLISHPAIGLGRGYQYYLSGGIARPGADRVVLPQLRRTVRSVPDLKDWLARVVKDAPLKRTDRAQFEKLLKGYSNLQVDKGRAQVASFYKEWIDSLARTPTAGRALALYEDLSTAYVTGKQLPDLPRGIGTATKPERVAEQLMLICL